jgi:hypothetical protein
MTSQRTHVAQYARGGHISDIYVDAVGEVSVCSASLNCG